MSRRRRRASGGEGAAGGERSAGGERPGAAGGERAPGSERAGAAGGRRPGAGGDRSGPPGRAPYRIRPLAQVAILVAVFAIVTLIAELAGASNLGVALGIGQIAFGIALVIVLVLS